MLRKQKDEFINAAIVVFFRYKTLSSIILAIIGLYLCQKLNETMSWTPTSTYYAGIETDRIDIDAPALAWRKERYIPQNAAINVTITTVPIHIIQPSTYHSSVLPWTALASAWDRNTTFEDLIRISDKSLLPAVPPSYRVVIIIHCSPKMGSRTLRNACRVHLQNTCGKIAKYPPDPPGYNMISELAELIQECNTTQHFCLRLGMLNKEERIGNTSFFHLYPFRNYDQWTVSALKQPYDVAGEGGCNQLKGMLDKCKDNHGELAFFKYPKTQMSKAQPLFGHRVNELKELHHIILYPFLEIDGLLSVLSNIYQIPLLPGSNGTDHMIRPKNGTCDKGILNQFHKCFTSKLMEL